MGSEGFSVFAGPAGIVCATFAPDGSSPLLGEPLSRSLSESGTLLSAVPSDSIRIPPSVSTLSGVLVGTPLFRDTESVGGGQVNVGLGLTVGLGFRFGFGLICGLVLTSGFAWRMQRSSSGFTGDRFVDVCGELERSRGVGCSFCSGSLFVAGSCSRDVRCAGGDLKSFDTPPSNIARRLRTFAGLSTAESSESGMSVEYRARWYNVSRFASLARSGVRLHLMHPSVYSECFPYVWR